LIIGDIVTHNARHYPDKAGLIDKTVSFTWKQVDYRTNSLANGLLGLGLQKGDRVAIISENNHYYAEFLLAISKTGLIGVGLNYRFTPENLTTVINDCRPRAILVQNRFVANIDGVMSQIGGVEYFIGMGEGHGYPLDYDDLLAESPGDEVEGKPEEDDIYLIIYTTGTTGVPKGAIHTHRGWQSVIVNRQLAYRLQADDVYLVHGPFYLAGGLQHFLTACFGGGTIVADTFSPGGFLELIEKEKVTVTHILPVHYKLLCDFLEAGGRKCDLSSLKKLTFGAGQPTLAEQVRDILGFFGVSWSNKLYAMSEGIVSFLLSEDIAAGLGSGATEREWQRLNSVGKPMLSARVRIVDENGEDLPPGETGEILIKSDGWMTGYWNKPDITQEAFRGGWYHTSDMGIFDEDGYLYLQGRKDTLIKSGGLFVAPKEVEDVILRHPAIAEVAVIGVQDDVWGQMVKAVVALKKGQQATEREIKDHCRQHLPGYQVPKSVDFIDKLPKDPTYGKIALKELMKRYNS